MIRFAEGNLLESGAEALVNTVNTVGVMGKGIALMFKDAFPDNFRVYSAACKCGSVQVGTMFIHDRRDMLGPKWIVNFPTKRDWRQPSRIEWIVDGLSDLRAFIEREQVRSIALPPLGAGNGGLRWSDVKADIEAALSGLPGVDIAVYEPTAQYQNVSKRTGVRALTPAGALLTQAIRQYGGLGFECTLLEAQKLAWFLNTAAGDLGLAAPFSLRFQAQRYGPYADGLRHLLERLDGTYLHCAKRITDAKPLDVIWCDHGMGDRVDAFLGSGEAKAALPLLAQTSRLIEGFESPFGLELLATVDWLRRDGVEASVGAMRAGIAAWPFDASAAARKARLFDDRVVGLALERLREVTPVGGGPPTAEMGG